MHRTWSTSYRLRSGPCLKRSLELTLSILALVALCCVALGQGVAADPVKQEWRIRGLALDSGSFLLEPAESWTEQWAQLEALRRRLELGHGDSLDAAECEQLVEFLEHAAPNVRAAALACLELAEFATWDAATVAKLAEDPLPEVRTHLCRAVPAESWCANLAILEQLARSDDEDVRNAARHALFGLDTVSDGAPVAAIAQAQLLGHVLEKNGVRAYLFEVERWSRLPRALQSRLPVTNAERLFRELDESGNALRAARALGRAACSGPLEIADAKVVADGWGIPLDPEWSSEHRMQRKLMLAAARRSGRILAVELLAVIERVSQAEPSLEHEFLLERLFEGLLEAETTSWILPQLSALELGESELVTFWSIASVGEQRFDPVLLESWLATEHSAELRVLVADLLVSVFSRTHEADALSALVRLLQDPEPELRETAFRALCAASSETVNSVALEFFEAWQGMERTDRLAMLRHLPRESALPVFRAPLLELGGAASLRRTHPSILELLGKFEGDAECVAHLSAWLGEDAAYIVEHEPSAPGFREAEIAARGGVRALHAVGGEKTVPQLEAALRRTMQASMDVAKTSAWCLGRTRAGLPVLELYLRGDVPTRVRVEAALALARRGAASAQVEASAVLVERYSSCDDELRGRILAAFAATYSEVGHEFAQGVFTNPGSSESEAIQALEVLCACFERDPSDANFAQFALYIELAQSQEARRLVIEALGKRRDLRARTLFEERLMSGPDALGAERQELLVALARIAPDSPLLWTELWRLPFETAEARLVERFRGKIPAAIAFSFRGEIEALKEISAARAWPAKEPTELRRLDGQLALALAEACRAAGDDEHATRLERVALVALAGELSNEKARLAGLRARARLWASAEAGERNSEAAHLAERLFTDWARAEISERDLETLFGAFDFEQGRDPLARLVSSALQARAREAASAGDLKRARELLAEARTQLGDSRAAREQQATLERDLR